ncbi:hypothetical protein [Bacteroides sp.]|uniref:hypothetical protein n=1 Tax=Bacteroides sp. TaxID=29523 RepID=UPI003D09D1DB
MNELTVNKIPASKEEQAVLSSAMISSVLEGEIDPIKAVIQAKSLVETLTLFLKDKGVNDLVLREVEKYGKQTSKDGATISIKEVGSKWDYSECGDPIYNRLSAQKAEIEEKLKERESLLKATKESRTEVDEETGEVYTVNPPSKSSTTSYSITFQKCSV